jgi:hypothetical protein
VHHGHRYLHVGLNPHTEKYEQWYDPDGNPSPIPPRPDDLTQLPDGLAVELIRTDGGDLPSMASDTDAQRLLAAMPAGLMTPSVREELDAALADLSGESGSRHDATRDHVRTLVLYGHCRVAGAPAALQALRGQFVEAVWHDPDRGSRATAEHEYDELVKWTGRAIAGQALGKADRALQRMVLRALEPGGGWHPDTPKPWTRARDEPRSIFKVLGPTEWAQPVADPEFLIAGVLCRDTFGVNAGPKKSLKTHDNQALALAVATGRNLYLDERFPVRRTGRVLYIVGEGGEVPVRRTLHRMARAYGVSADDIGRDPEFPLAVAFGAAPMNVPGFRDELVAMLDTYQPELVLIESFYNFHPSDVETGNLYQRGQVIDAYHRLVRGECAGATSLLTDHYRSTGTSKSLDLDSISMAGQAENADSWILRRHREDADVPGGEFRLCTSFNSRQWGATEWNVNWHLGEFDHTRGHHVGDISWSVESSQGKASAATTPEHKTADGRARLILAYVDENPETAKTSACEVLAQRHPGGGERNFRTAWTELENARLLVQAETTVTRPYGDKTRDYPAKVWKRSDGKIGTVSMGGADDA